MSPSISPMKYKLSDTNVAQAANSLRKANKAIEDAYRADEDFDIFLKEVRFMKVNENYDLENSNYGDNLVNIDDI